MQNSLVSGDDMRYLVQQTPEALTTIMGQMISLVQDITDLQNDTDERIAAMEKQPWYKKMWMTITGKNASSKAEIQRNQDKIVGYISEAVSQLYQMNCINQQVMCSLGNRMNQVYAQVTKVYNEQLQMKAQMAEIMAVQQQTIQALGGFVTKLNEKIESIDNFHMLITEIQQGHYQDESQLYSLCCVLAQLDKRTLEDDRKLNILRDALTQSGIINEDSISIQQYLMDILTFADTKIGVVYLELCNFRNSFPANLFAEMIETYHFIPKMEKISKNKAILIQKLLAKYELDNSAEFSFIDVVESFLENKRNCLIDTNAIQIPMNAPNAVHSDENAKIKYAEELYMHAKFEEAYPIIEELANNGNGRAMYLMAEFYSIAGDGCRVVEPSHDKTKYWRQQGTKAGEILAELNSPELYKGNPDSFFAEMIPKVKKLAEKGDAFAKLELECLDEKNGFRYLTEAAKTGYFKAQLNLGLRYYMGYGVSQSKYEAFKWFRKVAEQGYVPTIHPYYSTMRIDSMDMYRGNVVINGSVINRKIWNGDVVIIFSPNGVFEATIGGLEMFHKALDYAEKGDSIGVLLKGITLEQIKGARLLIKVYTDLY